MKIAVITVAGISSRFNEGLTEEDKQLKAVYYEKNPENTLLYHMILKCSYADKIILVGGYRFDDLKEYCSALGNDLNYNIDIVFNSHYEDLSSGFSLYLGLDRAFTYNPSEIVFVEGDLDIDNESFENVIRSNKSVLTYTYEPIYANKAVVLYKTGTGNFRYAFNSSHGLLSIEDSFSCILNSGQTWKFTDIDALKLANDRFISENKGETNLRIIQNYLDSGVAIDLVPLKHWTNCNTRDDYKRLLVLWEEAR